jgi:hypothetical protein
MNEFNNAMDIIISLINRPAIFSVAKSEVTGLLSYMHETKSRQVIMSMGEYT